MEAAPHFEYLDFDLEICPSTGDRKYTSIARSPAGEAREEVELPYNNIELESILKDIRLAVVSSAGDLRQAVSSEEKAARDFGRAMFKCFLGGQVGQRYLLSVARARHENKGLRVKLHIDSPGLAVLPWEFLYDDTQGEYVCLDYTTPLMRYISLASPVQPITIAPPLRVLFMAVSPADRQPRLNIHRERQRIETALQPLVDAGEVAVHWLEGATSDELQEIMMKGPWHVFHFIGHGGFDPASDEGLILLEDTDGSSCPLMATQLGRLLTRHPSMRLVVLNSCEGARGGSRDIFSSTASILVRRGIPAVLAMQYEISDKAAIQFSTMFYKSIAAGSPVDASVTEARTSISIKYGRSLEWATPVLYMRAPDGVLYHIDPELARELARIRAEQEELRRQEAARLAQEQIERETAEKERLAREQSLAAARRAELERLAREQAQKAELERLQKEQEQKAEQERIAREQAKKVEQERIAQERARKVEQERIAQEKTLQEKQERTTRPKDAQEQPNPGKAFAALVTQKQPLRILHLPLWAILAILLVPLAVIVVVAATMQRQPPPQNPASLSTGSPAAAANPPAATNPQQPVVISDKTKVPTNTLQTDAISWPIVFQDDFTNNDNQWQLPSEKGSDRGGSGSVQTKIENGYYVVSGDNPLNFGIGAFPTTRGILSNFNVSANFFQGSHCTIYGFLLRISESGGYAYYFDPCNSTANLHLARPSSNWEVLQSTKLSGIKPNEGRTSLRAILNGSLIKLYVNEDLVISATDTRYTSGLVGVTISFYNGDYQTPVTNEPLLRFDNFIIRSRE